MKAQEAITITNRGNVGIGTTSPDRKLTVQGKLFGGGDFGLEIDGSTIKGALAPGVAALIGDIPVTINAPGQTVTTLKLQTGGNDRLTINANGDVGIGTSTPNEKLHVKGISLLDTVRLGDTGNNGIFWDLEEIANNDFTLEYGAEMMRVTARGNVGIGEPNPIAKLHVGGTPGTDGIMFPDGTLQTTATLIGPAGADGAQGQKGDKGDKGDTGAQGVQGIQGLKGDKGDQGIQGIQGEKGDKGDKGAPGVVVSLDDIPSRIAGDPGVASGSWTVPYTNAANATDGDYSTYASGVINQRSDVDTYGYVTWDFGSSYYVSVVNLKADIIAHNSVRLDVEVSRDNINWVKGHDHPNDGRWLIEKTGPIPWYVKEQTFMIKYSTRYIRIKCEATLIGVPNVNFPVEFRIYEIKVR